MGRYNLPKIEIECEEFTEDANSFLYSQDMNTILLMVMVPV